MSMIERCLSNPRKIPLIALPLLLAASSALAQENPRDLRGFFPFVGVDVGYQTLSTNVGGEVDKNGLNSGLKLLGTYYREDWVFDLGLGYDFSHISGGTAPNGVSLETDSFSVDLGARYRLGSYAQVGPILSLWMGTDESYAQTVLESKSTLALLGVQALFDLPVDSVPMFRGGFSALRSLNLSDRSTYVFLVNLQIGFDLWGNRQRHEEKTTSLAVPPEAPPAPAPEPAVEPSAAEIAHVTAPRSVLVRFPEDRLLFEYKMSHLRADRRAYLATFAKFLAANPKAWESVIITGHTDNRGTQKVNDQLSEARAHTVFDVLGNEGVPRERMSFKGMGFRVPLDSGHNETAYQVNRRVELEFRGVTDPSLFSDQLNRIDHDRELPVEAPVQ